MVLGGWYGYCLNAKPVTSNRYTYAALSLSQSWFPKRPPVGTNYGRLWHESLLAVSSLSLAKSASHILPYVDSFLDNENIPVGDLLVLLGGGELGEFRNRWFAGVRGAKGSILKNGAYYYFSGALESFISKSGLEQGLFALEPLYISPLHELFNIPCRTFYRGRTVLGIKRFRSETLKLSTDPYFRGNLDLYGNKLISIGLEEDIMAPGELLGFRFTYIGFVDAAVVSDQFLKPQNKDWLLFEGVGIRLHNPRLIWKTFEFHVTWNQGYKRFDRLEFDLSAKILLNTVDFEGVRPMPYVYQ